MEQIFYRIESFNLCQFSMTEENYSKGKPVNVSSEIKFSYNKNHNILKNTLTVRLFQANLDILVMQIETYIRLKEETALSFTKCDVISIPKFLEMQSTSFGYGSLRGIMYLKTINTPLCNLILPPLNLQEMIKEDISIDLK